MEARKLVCHKEMKNGNFTIGKEYLINKEYIDDEDYLCFEITNDDNMDCDFTLEPDFDGESYATWFTLVEDDDNE